MIFFTGLSHLKKITAAHLVAQAQACLAMELEANYYFSTGRYWEHLSEIDGDVLKKIDAKWLAWMI